MSATVGSGQFTLTGTSRIVAAPGAGAVPELSVAADLAAYLRPATGYPLPVVSGTPRSGDIILQIGDPGTLPASDQAEGYQLVTTTSNATIEAPAAHGLYNGVQTFRQLLPAWINSPKIMPGPWTTPVADATGAGLYTAASGATGPKLVAFTQDNANPAHWSAELAKITATDVSNFKANMWYVNVLTTADPAGEVRGQIDASATPPAPPPAAPTLTQLTTTVFQVCGACHTGGGASLPASMNLTPGHIYASIVNVPSVEQPTLLRVKPHDPANSYVVQKLEGAPTITGARMPFGGPYLSQTQINQLEAWINAGALNN